MLRIRFFMPASAALALVCGLAVPAGAATVYSVYATGCGSSSGSTGPSSGYVEHAVGGGACDGFGSQADGKAFAGPEGLGAYGRNLHWGGSSTYGGGLAILQTEFMIIAPAGTALGTPVPVGLNLELHSVALDPSPDPDGAYVSLIVDLYINSFTYGRRLGERTSDGRTTGIGINVPNLNGDTFLVVEPVEVLYGAPGLLSIKLDANAQGATAVGQPLSINALNTLRLPRTGPVFNLPAGYSVNLPDLFVFDNRFVDPNPVGGAVPEPATCALVGGGLLLAAIWRRRR